MSLPPEVWFIICDILINDEDIRSLGALCCTSRLFEYVFPALYNVQRVTPSKVPWSEDSSSSERLLNWSGFWTTLLRSAAGLTSRDYVSYLKVFDVLDLDWFLEAVVRDKSARDKLTQDKVIPFFKASKTWKLSDVPIIIEQIAELMLPKCVNVEEISREPTVSDGTMKAKQFEKWLRMLPKLQSLRVLDGSCINQKVRDVMQEVCPNLNAFDIYQFGNVGDVDEHVYRFLSDVRRSWKSCVLRNCQIGNKTLAVLAQQTQSLKHLELWSYKVSGSCLDWASLRGLEALEVIAFLDFSMPAQSSSLWQRPFEAFFSGPFTRLRILQLDDVSMPIDISILVMQNSKVLEELKIKMKSADPELTMMADTPAEQVTTMRSFCELLQDQTYLEELELSLVTYENISAETGELMVPPLSKLSRLRKITLGSTSTPFGFFRDTDVEVIGQAAENFEVFKLASFTISDTSLSHLKSRRKLRWFESSLPSSITGAGLLEFVQTMPTLENLLYVGILEADIVEEIEGVLTNRSPIGRFTHFDPYTARNDYGQESDSDEDDDYIPAIAS